MLEARRHDLGLTDKGDHCACSGAHGGEGEHRATGTAAHPSGEAIRRHYLVAGMTCAHCVASVTEELTAVDGVESVTVDLKAGAASPIMVVSSRLIQVDEIRRAVSEAGYDLVTA
jgi:copper chaperone CopZ